ncbi:hypothetical protein BURK_005307 [Burkholderia sp. SJ98]|uniref:hypothetical protein n=1 Tax=Caballeronia zhejiangensis TaxID=871203 RepID=UPI00025BA009|nr:hypothetical protein [Caballeronia zhejiangensis]EKS72432.1 hypothetical protein BURK_005307 [Burkholderia sp. SJ98]
MSNGSVRIDRVMRATLENIRDRFDTDQTRYVLFTTFNFASQFFEASVLPLLLGDSVDELKGASETRYAINEDLKQLRCLVVCDRSTGPEPKGDLRYGLLPVGLPEGRFHPKLMLMAGTLKDTGQRGMWLSVGSGNLTLSGWAINREVIGRTIVARQHASALRPLIAWLAVQAQRQVAVSGPDAEKGKEEGEIREILDYLHYALAEPGQLASDTPDMPALHLSLPFEGRALRAMIDDLKGARRWRKARVVSPYWSGVDRIVGRLGVEQCVFTPSVDAEGKYRFPIETLAPSQSYARSFERFAAERERYTHAKALMLEDDDARVLCIGSANFTRAAMLGDRDQTLFNVEAMLRYSLAPHADPWHGAFENLGETELTSSGERDEEDSAPPLPPFEAIVTCDWRTKRFHAQLTVTSDETVRDIVLRVDGFTHLFATATRGQTQVASLGPFSAVHPVRSFHVSYVHANEVDATFRGLVTQLRAFDDELGYQARPRLKKVLELLRKLNPALPESRMRERAALGTEGGDGEEESAEPTFDFFGLFQGTWKMLEYYGTPDSAGNWRNPFDSLAPYGATTLYRAITLQAAETPEEKIGRYIQLAELRDVVERLEASGRHRQDDDSRRGLNTEIDLLTVGMTELLANSSSFRSTFGEVTPERCQAFLEWFHDELRNKADQAKGATHE